MEQTLIAFNIEYHYSFIKNIRALQGVFKVIAVLIPASSFWFGKKRHGARLAAASMYAFQLVG
jgi:hypothetical protein